MTPADCRTAVRLAGESFLGALLDAVWGVKVSGLENVLPEGPLIIAGNHVSLADGNVLGWAVHTVRRPRFLAKRELFANPFLARFFIRAGGIPLDRKGDVAAMRAAVAVLQAGGSLIMFPEGRRLKPGESRTPKAGVGFLAAAASAPVLPARLLGLDRFPWARPFEVRLGRPLPPPPPGRAAARDFSKAVMDAVYAL